MSRLKVAAIFAPTLLLACSCRLAEKSLWEAIDLESTGLPRPAKSPSWEALDLESANLDSATLYYERSLEPKLGVFRKCYERFLAQRDEEVERAQKLLKSSEEIVAEVNRIVGARPEEALNAELERVLRNAFRLSVGVSETVGKADFYFVTRGTVKDYLREGGELPGFTYDNATDTATYHLGLRISGTARAEKGRFLVSEFEFVAGPAIDDGRFSLPCRVTSLDTVREDLEADFSKAAGHLCAFLWGMPFHELAEMSILQRLRPYDPYYRWFSDGFANAVALRLLRKYVSEEAAEQFAADFDHSEYGDIEMGINLYYWMGPHFCIYTPLESERRMTAARYAYATLEAERCIQKHGIECIARILDTACKRPLNDSRKLVTGIGKQTGEDIRKRFRRYQTFEPQRKGLRKYTIRLNAATDQRDYQDALFNLLRVMELRGPQPRDYSNTAYLLFLTGHEPAGDQAIKQGLELLKRRGLEKAHFALQKVFVEYALKCRNLKKAYQVAEEVLIEEPDFVPALAARMHRLLASDKLSGAKEVARRILKLEGNKHAPPYKLAQAVLAIHVVH